MAKDERTELLQRIFENVNSWLHFVEAKNAALIAFNIALMAAFVDSSLFCKCRIFGNCIIIGICLSTIVAIRSFIPLNKEIKKVEKGDIKENLLHYAYIASLEVNEYIRKLYKRYFEKNISNISEVMQIERDYCEEIIQNSRITIRKQRYFKIGLNIVFFALGGICVMAIYAMVTSVCV